MPVKSPAGFLWEVAMLNNITHGLYIAMAGIFALLILRGLFMRKSRRSVVYDIVYAYSLIPFVMRVLQVK